MKPQGSLEKRSPQHRGSLLGAEVSRLDLDSRPSLYQRVEHFKSLARSLGLNPKRETLAKIAALQELLASSLSPGKAIEVMRRKGRV